LSLFNNEVKNLTALNRNVSHFCIHYQTEWQVKCLSCQRKTIGFDRFSSRWMVIPSKIRIFASEKQLAGLSLVL
jgi:hypothetical protein